VISIYQYVTGVILSGLRRVGASAGVCAPARV
jgi:hypothetical protein